MARSAVFNVELTNEFVYIVDDEASIGKTLPGPIRANGKHVRFFKSGQDIIDFSRSRHRKNVRGFSCWSGDC
jgi:FixJ family two-component response regulator